MSNQDIILKAVQFIEANLQNEISVLDISLEVGYSLFHFSRLFHGVIGHTPKDYLLRRRLTEAAKAILSSKKKISDIAFAYQFNDSETFNRAFKRTFGLNPTELRKSPNPRQLPLLNAINRENLSQITKIRAIEPDIVELDSIRLVGPTALVSGSTSIITELWAKFSIDVGMIHNRIIPERFYQVAFWPQNYDLNGFFVMCAVEVSDLDRICINLVGKSLPPAKYLRFIHKGLACNVGLTYRYIYETWLPQSDYKLSLDYNFEYYGKNHFGPDSEESESEIYIPIESYRPT